MLLLGPILILIITVLIVLATLWFFVKSIPAHLSKDHSLIPPTPSESPHSDSQDTLHRQG